MVTKALETRGRRSKHQPACGCRITVCGTSLGLTASQVEKLSQDDKMDDTDIMAAMGIAGFGKQQKKRQLDPHRFDKQKRVESREVHMILGLLELYDSLLIYIICQVTPAAKDSAGPSKSASPAPGGSRPQTWQGEEPEFDPDDVGPPPPPGPAGSAPDGEPEFPGDEDDGDEELPEFPVTHELLLKDHTKVVSALALDPSGARIVSGSHDYDCKLWDFGGMDVRCKPFKTWEPAGTYYVRRPFLPLSGSIED